MPIGYAPAYEAHRRRLRTLLDDLPGPWGGGLDDEGWSELQELAAARNRDGEFVAIRGFEWSHPLLGHINVWDSPTWIAPVHPTATER